MPLRSTNPRLKAAVSADINPAANLRHEALRTAQLRAHPHKILWPVIANLHIDLFGWRSRGCLRCFSLQLVEGIVER